MGKAASQRRLKRMKYLVRLARDDPDRFDTEWEKRLSSWLELIRQDAGRLRDRKNRSIPSIFARVDEALTILEACGEKVWRQYAEGTFDLLATECCRQFGRRVDRRLFRLNVYPKLA